MENQSSWRVGSRRKINHAKVDHRDSGTIITRIRRHRAQLEKLGVKSVSIFGSVARGEKRLGSDVDILVEFKGKATLVLS